jgi:probable phosphoglycerate mutase
VRLILVRHGESIGNSENRLQGQTDYDLTELGRQQAALTAVRLARAGVKAVYTSNLLRARATAELIAERLGTEAVVEEDVSEYHFGEMSGITYREARERFGANVSQSERVYPGEEGREVFYDRVTAAIWRVVEAHPGGTAAVVSHGGPIALYCQMVLGLPYRRPMPFAIDNCSLNVIDYDDVTGVPAQERRSILVQLNDRCHLRGMLE